MRLFANANFDFIGHRRVAYLLSGGAIVLSLTMGVPSSHREEPLFRPRAVPVNGS